MTDAITSSNNSLGTGNAASSSTSSAATSDSTQVTKNMFLQLLVAQIKNQDPLNPTDGVQFLTQLAQFQQLEQSMNMGEDIAAARTDLDKLVQATSQVSTAQTN
ncbi:MAG TPA: flagellar hook capping FlgD N-terminal domain-containing protein [Candidatus Acidoferrales bacterium]|nr:flagellar hook capping FlgD N-terminal domain-containing protein [Candidatus Acidoferrales bacterium]